MATRAIPTQNRPALLERDEQLSLLHSSLSALHERSAGGIVLIGGEAGVGKTALVRRFARELSGARVLAGSCDPISTPRPLGPFLEVAEAMGGDLEQRAAGGVLPHEFASELLRELRAVHPSVLILEDLHWADAATLDVLRLIARRVQTLPALVVATYRDDEVDSMHPLRMVLGELATYEGVCRLRLVPLSKQAVAEMASPEGIDPDELYRRTGGNPFFVTEVLATGSGAIPQTVQDAVLARVSRLSSSARNLVEAVAIMPSGAEVWLLESLGVDAVDSLDECLATGVLGSFPGGVAFRHEIARLAVDATIPSHRRSALHAGALAALSASPSGAQDMTRLAHHAEGARDVHAVLEFAPAAARRASSMGAHREAAGQLQRALRFADELPAEERAELLSRKASECFATGDYDEAISARRQALDCYRQIGDRLREGDALSRLSANLRCHGLVREAEVAGKASLEVLRSMPPGGELARAYAQQAMLALNIEDLDEAQRWGSRALDLAELAGDRETLLHAMNTMGTAGFLRGNEEGRVLLERSLALSKQFDLSEQAGRAYINLAWASTRIRAYAQAEAYEREGYEYCLERGLDAWRCEVLAHRASRRLDKGAWGDAVEDAATILRSQHTNAVARTIALSIVALVRARRGDPDYRMPLDQARAIAAPTGELQHLAPAAAAAAEIAWLGGGPGAADSVREVTEETLELAIRTGAGWVIGELACWRHRAGIRERLTGEAAGPYALELRGDNAAAAAAWLGMQCGYEAAVALCSSDAETGLRWALEEFQRLGARGPAGIAARRLRERGARGLPRGPRASTRQNQANLTSRELEVLGLVARGLRNRDMAATLFISEKTVDHHVSAILRKLGLRTRAEAIVEAVRLGITT